MIEICDEPWNNHLKQVKIVKLHVFFYKNHVFQIEAERS